MYTCIYIGRGRRQGSLPGEVHMHIPIERWRVAFGGERERARERSSIDNQEVAA
jgi:hypothetical protein